MPENFLSQDGLKNIRLTGAERESMRSELMRRAKDDHSVREDQPRRSSVMHMGETLLRGLTEDPRLALRPEERTAMLRALRIGMIESEQQKTGFVARLFRWPTLSGAVAVLVVMSGTALAAENALPGDLLYPVKIHVNENVRASLSFSTRNKAEWNIERSVRRLEEAEALLDRAALTAKTSSDVAKNFESHVAAAHRNIEEFRATGDAAASAELSARLESALAAHEKVLRRRTDENGAQPAGAGLRNLLTDVKSETDRSMRQTDEATADAYASTDADADIHVAAKDGIRNAREKISRTRSFIDRETPAAKPEAIERAKTKLNAAQRSLDSAEEKFRNGADAGSFATVRMTLKDAEEAKLLVREKPRHPHKQDHEESTGHSTQSMNAGVSLASSRSGSPHSEAKTDAHGHIEDAAEKTGGDAVDSDHSPSSPHPSPTDTLSEAPIPLPTLPINTKGNRGSDER